jgi:hypothetical protein
MNDDLIYLDSYVLQRDMRIRLPKSVLANLKIEKGKTQFSIYLDQKHKCIVLKADNAMEEHK